MCDEPALKGRGREYMTADRNSGVGGVNGVKGDGACGAVGDGGGDHGGGDVWGQGGRGCCRSGW